MSIYTVTKGSTVFEFPDDYVDSGSHTLNAAGVAVEAALTAIFNSATSSFLSSLPSVIRVLPNGIDGGGLAPGNAAYYAPYANRAIGWLGGSTASSQAAAGNTLIKATKYDNVVSTPTQAYNFLAIGSDVVTGTAAFVAKNPANLNFDISLARAIFHELAHAVTIPTIDRYNAFTGVRDASHTNDPLFVADRRVFYTEDLAIAAENYIFRQMTAEHASNANVRVGHNPAEVVESNDPTSVFDFGATPIVYSAGSADDSFEQRFSQTYGDGSSVTKIYHSKVFAPDKISKATYNNYTVVSADDPSFGLLNSSGTVSTLLTRAITGIVAVDPSIKLGQAVAADAAVKSAAGALVADSSMKAVLTQTEYDQLKYLSSGTLQRFSHAQGLTNEISVSDELRAGPQRTDAGHEGEQAPRIVQNLTTSGIVFGAGGYATKGFALQNVTDTITGSGGEDLVLLGDGTNGADLYNLAKGEGGNDLILGGAGSDLIQGGGDGDIIALSAGQDVIEAEGGFDSIVARNGVNTTFKFKADGGVDVTSGNSRSIVSGAEFYVGGDALAIFEHKTPDGTRRIMAAGSGGAIFNLSSGDIAIGATGVVDKFYLSTNAVPPGCTDIQGYLKKINYRLLNLEASDEIYVNNIKCTGANIQTTLLDKVHEINGDSSAGAFSYSGTSGFGLSYAVPQLQEGGYYELPSTYSQRTASFTPLDTVSPGLGLINFSAYNYNGDTTYTENLNLFLSYSDGIAGMHFSRDSAAPSFSDQVAPTFYAAMGSQLLIDPEGTGDKEYASYSPYGVASDDWDWVDPVAAVSWASNNTPLAVTGTLPSFVDQFSTEQDIFDVGLDLSDSGTAMGAFGFDPNGVKLANNILYVDPELGISTSVQLPFDGVWKHDGEAVMSEATALGIVSFDGETVSLDAFDPEAGVSSLEDGTSIYIGENSWYEFTPTDSANGPTGSTYVGAEIRRIGLLDQDQTGNRISVNAAEASEVGIDVGFDSPALSATSPSFAFSLENDAGGAFAIDSVTGVVTVANDVALASLHSAQASITVRVTTEFGHRDANFAIGLIDAATYTTTTGTSGSETLTGTSTEDQLEGLAGNDLLQGASGNDKLIGGDGTNTLEGGAGNDILIGGDEDDLLSGGVDDDTIFANGGNNSITFDLGDGVDEVFATGAGFSSAATATAIDFGSSVEEADVHISQSADGRDVLLTVGEGGDQLILREFLTDPSMFGTISVNFASSVSWGFDELASRILASSEASIERTGSDLASETMLGGAFNDNLSGGDGTDTLLTGDGNDTLNGGIGADTLKGGIGDDLYIVGDVNDTIVEVVASGTDEVSTTLSSYALDDNVENLTFSGSGNFAGIGNDLDNIFKGGAGDDTFTGGVGNDTYYIANSSDVVVESADEGSDEVRTSLASYTLGANLEALSYTGTGNFIGIGNNLGNAIKGGDGNDELTGGDEGDFLDGGAGQDILTGGLGDDTYVVDNAGDIIAEATDEGFDQVNTTLTTFALGSNFEALAYLGEDAFTGTGNSQDNIISSGDGADILDGGAGADTLSGGLGDDTYYVDNVGDTVAEIALGGYDTVFTTVNFTLSAGVDELHFVGTGSFEGTGNDGDNVIVGGDGDDVITGGGGNDTLDGGLGSDALAGGLGDDLYFVDDAGDVVTEAANSGYDEVYVDNVSTLTLAANVEGLHSNNLGGLTATGNALDNAFYSADTTGIVESFSGGVGNDTYFINDDGDIVVEAANEGIDTVVANLEDYVLPDNVENVEQGNYTTYISNFTGNSLNNVFNLGGGEGILTGGDGNDTYVFFNNDFTVVENADEGVDEVVFGNFNYTLGANVEKLTLGFEDWDYEGEIFTGTGNALDNTITGGLGTDDLDGAAGSDELIGLAGNDTYHVDNTGDTVVEVVDAGIDGVVTSLTSYTLGANVELLTYEGSSAFTGTGNSLDNVFHGGSGSDAFTGGSGDDVYYLDESSDTAIEASGEGTDTVVAAVDHTLEANIENLIYAGLGDFNGEGNASANQISGGNGDDTLDGKAGADAMKGGKGNDIYYVDDTGDLVQEILRQGTDEVRTTLTSYALSSNVENLTYLGSSAFAGVGNNLANVLVGGSDDDVLTGNAGNDMLNGGGGADIATFAGDQTDYTISTSGGSIFVADDEAGIDGDDGTDELVAIETARFKGNDDISLAPPIILDLDGDGLELVNQSSSRAIFDWNGDGVRDRTGWIGKGDGLLVFDRDGNGKVSGASELSFINDKPGARSDLEGLQAFDSNGDGVFSAGDAQWNSFRIWQDKDGDGKVDKGEFLTMGKAKVASINLTGTATNQEWAWGDNIVVNTGSFMRTNGRTGSLGDVALTYSASQSAPASQVHANRLVEALGQFGLTDAEFHSEDRREWHAGFGFQMGAFEREPLR